MSSDTLTHTNALDVPLGELIRSLALAVADAQAELDRSSMMKAELMSGQSVLRDWKTGALIDADGKPSTAPVLLDSRVYFGHDLVNGQRVPLKMSMLELGFSPTFYQFVDTMIEVRIAVRMSKEERGSGDTRYRMTGTTVDATYTASYNYDLNAAALFKTKLVPIPAPAVLEQRIQLVLEKERAHLRAEEAARLAAGTGADGVAGTGSTGSSGGGATAPAAGKTRKGKGTAGSQ